MSADALDSLPGPCKQSCRLAIDYAHPELDPCNYGSFFNTYLDACLELKCRNKADDPNAVSTYILAQVYDQLKACGPDTWAWQYLNRVAPGYSAAPTTYLVTSWESATLTLADGKETVSSSAVSTRMVTEKFWVQEVKPATTTGETLLASAAESIASAEPFGTQGSSASPSDNGVSSSSSSNSYAGIIAGCVIGGIALWVLSIFAAVWVYKRRKRRKENPKVNGEDGANDFEKPRTVEIYTPREKVEVGEGEIYEIGIHEAFELDAAETELQGNTGRLDADDTEKESPVSSKTHETTSATFEIEGAMKGEDKAEQKALGKGGDTGSPSG